MTDLTKLPRYQCHKQVRAAKIFAILIPSDDPNSRDLVMDDSALPVIRVTAEWVANRKAEVGGYFVLYDDGYQSWSPADAFESGYTLIGGPFPFAKEVEGNINTAYVETQERRAGVLEQVCIALQQRTGKQGEWHPDVVALMNAYHRAEQLTDPNYAKFSGALGG